MRRLLFSLAFAGTFGGYLGLIVVAADQALARGVFVASITEAEIF